MLTIAVIMPFLIVLILNLNNKIKLDGYRKNAAFQILEARGDETSLALTRQLSQNISCSIDPIPLVATSS